MQQRLLFLLAWSLAASYSPAAAAQERWVFVPVFVGAAASAGQLTVPLEQTKDLPTLPNLAAAAHFESAGSSEPGLLTEEQLARLMEALSEGIKQLQANQRRRAEQQLTPIENLDPKARDYLQRSPARAQALFHACLLTAKEGGDEKQQEAEARHLLLCARAFPGFEPMSGIPPKIRKSFEDARAQLANEPHGTVEIVSSREGCVVRANGLAIGTTPLSLSLPVGAFRFQVECGTDLVGRVHALRVQPGTTHISIDAGLDAVVHTQGALWLAYPDKATRDAQVDGHGRALGRLLDSSHVLLLLVENGRLPGPVQVRVRALEPATHDFGTVVFAPPHGYMGRVFAITEQLGAMARRAALARAAAAPVTSAAAPVTSTESVEPVASFTAGADAEDPDDEQADQSPSSLPLVAAASLGALGLGGLIVSWVTYAQRFDLRTQHHFQSVPFATQKEFRVDGYWTLSLGAAGAALLAAAAPLALPRADGMPMVGWVTGGAGVAVAAVGIGFGLFGRHCRPEVTAPDQPRCGAFVADATFGPLVAEHGIPLLAVTATYAIRHWLENEDIALNFNGRELVLSGKF